MKHKTAEKLHAIKRFKERIGVSLTNEEYLQLCKKCTDRKYARFIGWREDDKYVRHQVLEIEDFGFRFRVLYNPIHFRIVTVLFAPIVYLDKNRQIITSKRTDVIEPKAFGGYANSNNFVAI